MHFPRCAAPWLLALLGGVAARGADLRLETSATWAENISRSSASSDWRDAMRYDATVATSLLRQWSDGFITTAEAGIGGEYVPRFTKTNAATLQFDGHARQKFGWGAFAPVLAFDAGLHGRATHLDGDDGWTARAGLRLSKRVTQAWRFGAVADWQQHYADSRVFETRHHRLFATITWDVTRRLQLTHGNGRLWGDFTANASPNVWPRALSGALGPAIAKSYNTLSWATTDSYGPGWVTYRVTGHVNFWWLELSPALGRDTSLPLRFESRYSVNQVGVRYRQDLWTVQLLRRF